MNDLSRTASLLREAREELQDSNDRAKAPFEREIDAVSSFNPVSVLAPAPFEYRPVDKVCPCCQRKHCDHSVTCAECAPYWV